MRLPHISRRCGRPRYCSIHLRTCDKRRRAWPLRCDGDHGLAGVGFACLAARQSSVMVPMINPTLSESRNRTLSGLPVVGNWWQPRGDCGKPGPLRPRSRRADRRARLPEERRRIVKVPSRVLAPRLDVSSGALKAAGNSTALPFGKSELQCTPKRREINPRPRAVQIHGAHIVPPSLG